MNHNLYNIDILSLASNIPLIGYLEHADSRARKVSRLCGSWHESDVCIQNGHILDFRQRLKACALGQASASILGEQILNASIEEVIHAFIALKAMLKEKAPPPTGRFERLALLKSVSDYPQRHSSTLLAFETAYHALKQLNSKHHLMDKAF